jgi:hypothetical protein
VLSAKLKISDVLTSTALSGVGVTGSGVTGGTTDGAGSVTISAAQTSTYAIDLAASGYVSRNTLIKVPGSDVTLSLISGTFDLTAFDQMFRSDVLQRWTAQPNLRIETRVLDYTGDGSYTYPALGETLTDAEVAGIRSDLTYGLPLLTGNGLPQFATIETHSPAAGESVAMLVEGRITFARCRGVTAARGAAGFATWQFRSDNVVTGGLVCIDRDFELSGSDFLRAVRLHELGHALGAQHVTAKSGVLMNPTISVTDVTQFDRDAAKIAFSRPPGNRSPDRDPASFSLNALGPPRVREADRCGTIRR